MERRRGPALQRALLEAAWGELAERGYPDVTLDGVAARAGTSRPVLARRWADKPALVRAALEYFAKDMQPAVPNTGSLRGDVLAMMRALNAIGLETVIAMTAAVSAYHAATGTSPATLRSELLAEAPSALDDAFSRAAARGEVELDQITSRMRTLPMDLLRQEIMLQMRPVEDDVLEEIVDTLFLPLVSRMPVLR